MRLVSAALSAALLVLGPSGAFGQERTAAPTQSPQSYRLIKTIDLPGPKGGAGGAISFDGDTGTVWLAQTSRRNLVVIETKGNTVRQVIDGIDAPLGIGFSEHYAFVTDAANAAAVVIGKRSFEKATVLKPVGNQPDGIYFDVKHGTLWVASAGGEMIIYTAVGRGGFKRLAGLRLKPSPVTEPPGIGLYLAAKDRLYQPVQTAIDVIDPRSRRIEHLWKTTAVGRITGLAYDARTDRLVAGTSGGEILILDARNGKSLAKLSVPGSIGQVAIDVGLRRAYAANRSGQTHVIDLDHNSLVASVASDGELEGLTVDPRTHLVYLYRNQSNKVDVLAPP